MQIIENLLPKKVGVRTGLPMTKILGLVIHWIGTSQSRASVIRGNFERTQLGTHYISDHNDGHIIRAVPEDEMTYHVGSSTYYTPLKKELVGGSNPNKYFVGIECCISDSDVITSDYSDPLKYKDLGKPSEAQYKALVEFAADFLDRHGLTSENLYRHFDITAKPCHIWFVKDSSRWDEFKYDVNKFMKENYTTMKKSEVIEIIEEYLEARGDLSASEWAEKEGIISGAQKIGLSDGSRPRALATREEVIAMVTRSMQIIDEGAGK